MAETVSRDCKKAAWFYGRFGITGGQRSVKDESQFSKGAPQFVQKRCSGSASAPQSVQTKGPAGDLSRVDGLCGVGPIACPWSGGGGSLSPHR
jgi:hypothetical protein